MFSDFKDALNGFLKDNALWICLVLIGVIVIIVGVLLFAYYRSKKQSKNKQFEPNEYFDAVGGKENIKNISIKGSRITLELNDNSKINKEKLRTMGVNNILTMSDKFILVVKIDAEKFYNHFN